MGLVDQALGQSDAELDALSGQVQQLHRDGKYQQAIGVAERYVEAAKNRGEDDPAYATAIGWLAHSLQATNQLAHAEPLMRRALAIDEASFGPAHPKVAFRLNNLGLVLMRMNRVVEAEPLLRRGLANYEKSMGPEHANVAVVLNNLAHLLRTNKRLDEVEGLYRRVLAIQEKNYGSGHGTVAVTLDSLASLLQLADRLEEAETHYRRALAIKESRFGADHIAVAGTLASLASVLATTSRPSEAETLYRRALSIQETSLGPDHPTVGATLRGLAGVLVNVNRTTQAEPLYRRALAINEKNFGKDDASLETINNLIGLALMMQATGRFAEAEAIYHRSLALNENKYGPDHPNVADALDFLATLFSVANRHNEAEVPLRRALAIREKNVARDPAAVARILENLAGVLKETNRPTEAEQFYRRAMSIAETNLGSDHWLVGSTLISLAVFFHERNNHTEADPIIHRLLRMPDTSYGPNHSFQATNLNRFAQILFMTNRLAEAEALHRRALAMQERNSGPEHPYVAQVLSDLAQLLFATSSRFAEAEQLLRRALTIQENSFGAKDASVATTLTSLAQLLQATNRFGEAEPLHRRALAIRESTFGPQHMLTAVSLNSVAHILAETNRLSEAELLIRRALSIQEGSNPEHWGVVVTLNNLAYLLMKTDRLTEAEPLYRRALATGEKAFAANHWMVATLINNLALLLQETSRFEEAEPLFRRALTISETSLSSTHPNLGRDTNNLAWLLQTTGRFADAEPLYRRSLAIFETSLGAAHPNLALPLTNLAGLFAERGDWAAALTFHRRAKPILTGPGGVEGSDRTELAKSRLAGNAAAFRAHARAAHSADADGASAREEGFEAAQWALQTGAADALTQMSARFAKGSGPLAALVRERQDVIIRRRQDDRRLLEAVGKGDAKAAEAIRAAIAGLDTKLDTIDRLLAKDFPQFAELSSPKPLSIQTVQALLEGDEALIVFLDIPRFGKLPEEMLAWAVTRSDVRWIRTAGGTAALSEKVATLRCGLDRDGLWSWSGRQWVAKGERCKALKPNGLGSVEPLPFDLTVARELYDQLLKPFANLIEGKSLIIVPSGSLTSLPFHVLVTEPLDASDAIAPQPPGLAAPTPDYRKAAWLALKHPIALLPSVGSLQVLRKLGPSQAKEPYVAFGNPLLNGGPADRERAKQALAKQKCPQDLEGMRQRVAGTAKGGIPALSSIWRGSVDQAELRRQAPLPETADELCAVAKSLGALGREAETVWLGARASETNLKTLSGEGKLARYRVLHFATHGLLAGESETILRAKAEPALVLTPPKEGTSGAELERDDGLLTASEVAQLQLDADWVVLSACNTAGGEKGNAETFSGLARAFFYAKARALLVSHWYVDSEAAVKLTTGAFAALRTSSKIGRAEALRRSMERLITEGQPQEAHPSVWAPFVLVGEGQAKIGAPIAKAPLANPKRPPATQAQKPVPSLTPDWRTQAIGR